MQHKPLQNTTFSKPHALLSEQPHFTTGFTAFFSVFFAAFAIFLQAL
jgi:hypothetical protein